MTDKPIQKSVALRYDPEQDRAPVLVAKGKGFIAERIIALAKEHGIFVHQDPALVELLMDVELADTIPPQLYQVVARVLAMVYRANRELAKSRGLDRK
ncbi:EscU/YscU/HrcU family type III secretion system export apparatus switch protein [bacterium]|nr:EscU/YscU/HrcU family type III secretion system export apparatus switch protein [bacterium]